MTGQGPLEGIRIIELGGIGPAPYCGQLLAEMGAEVILIERPYGEGLRLHTHGKRSLCVDLQKEGAAEMLLELVKTADGLVEGWRPGVAERLGIGPGDCHVVNPKLVYGRMTGWGQDGPWAEMAGHDINYLSITGALYAMGSAEEVPPTPLNLLGDFGGGSLFLLSGMLAALLRAERTGKGEVIDAAIIDGVQSMMGLVHALNAAGLWRKERGSNLLDGGAPYYRCYRTADGEFMAVGCLEPKFFAEMLRLLEIDPADYGGQNDLSKWPEQHLLLEGVFARRTRADWAAVFDGTDACVTPVLGYEEAASHPQNAARGTLEKKGDRLVAGPAPRFAAARTAVSETASGLGMDAAAVLAEAGIDPDRYAALVEAGIVVET